MLLRFPYRFCSALLSCLLALAVARADTGSGRTIYAHSYRAVPLTAAEAPAATRHAHLLRAQLRADELAASTTFEIALRMPNFTELQARLAKGEQIAPAQMAARYYPAASDYQKVIDWIKSQGLEVTRTDSNHLAVFGRGSVSAVAQAFQVSFGRVQADDATYTAALTAPSLPADVAVPVLGIHGLQPHLRLRRKLAKFAAPQAQGGSSAYTPANIAQHYNAAGLGLTGSGQTIAIFSAAFASSSDLQGFWGQIGLANPPTIQNVTVGSGPAGDDSGDQEEATLDEEWAGGLATGATIRVYGANDTDPNFSDEIFQQVAADLPSHPSIHVLSISYGFDETALDVDYVLITSQYCANLASAGVSIFNASGDDGSNQDGKLQVSVPTSDPNVTGVGGTTYGNGGETGWSDSGGGISVIFSRPSWQVGTGVPAGTMRLCPDVASSANPNYGAEIYFQGQIQQVGGTSWATPTWAAFGAMIDQYRASQGSGPIGNLNTRIYSLIGTDALYDITSGSNGAYQCGIGYDMVTGVGTPDLQNLYTALLAAPAGPAIYSQFGNVNVTPGIPATFDIVATGAATLTYQWQREANGSSTWTNLSDNGQYQGSATAMLRVLDTGAAGAMGGDWFQCVVTNGQGAATSKPEQLVVNVSGVSTLAGWPGEWGNVDGTGFAARFESPGAIRGDGQGNLYVADGSANTVRRVTALGVVTTVAGLSGVTGSANGSTSVATFNGPAGVAIASNGNFFVADNGNQSVREVSNGNVTTFATGFTDPQDVACDSAGNLYVADGQGNTVKKVTPAGAVSVLAGSGSAGLLDGTGTAASFNYPVGVAVDSSGNVYVADNKNDAVRVISAQGAVTTLARGLHSPTGVTLDTSGNVYVACQGDYTVRMVTPSGTISLLAGQPDVSVTLDGTLSGAEFADPTQAYWDPSSGILYVIDSNTFTSSGSNSTNNFGGTVRTVAIVSPPQIIGEPSDQAVNLAGSCNFIVGAIGSGTLGYQWQVEAPGASTWVDLTDASNVGSSYVGSATSNLIIDNAQASDSGNAYRCVVTDSAGSTLSSIATLTVQGSLPVVPSYSLPAGGSLTLSANAGEAGTLTYQWYLNGSPIAGATGATYTISNYTSADAGGYTVTVTGSDGPTNLTIAMVSTLTARLTNLSANAITGTGSGILSAGFVIGGSGSKNLLLRGPGPTLANFGVSNPIPDPVLTLFNSSSAAIASNSGWANNAALAADFSATGAFAFPQNSADAAMAQDLATASYTMSVQSVSGQAGAAMVEIYDMDPTTSTARLVNLSSRVNVSSTSSLTAGFVVGGTGEETVLIRGIGPTLSQFGVANPLAHPVLTLYNSSQTMLMSNSGWGGSVSLGEIFGEVGAFALPAGSADAAIVTTLPTGNYTAVITSGDGASGVALVEVYEAP